MGTKIEWCDETWNPLTGCTKVSPGCDHCYAETLHERFHGKGSFATVTLHPDRLDQPLKWRKPRKVFVNSMSDLFHKDVPDEYIARVFAVIAKTPRHTYQVLTKRHGRMRSVLSSPEFLPAVAKATMAYSNAYVGGYRGAANTAVAAARLEQDWPLRNVWLGVSVEDQHWADIRIPALLETPAAVRWISAEPLLGPVDLQVVGPIPGFDALLSHPRLDWVVAGGESGPRARPMHPDWVRSLRDQSESTGVPFLFKQAGAWTWRTRPGVDSWADREPDAFLSPDGRVMDEQTALAAGGDWQGMWRVGKGKAGRELDSRTWDEYPAVAS